MSKKQQKEEMRRWVERWKETGPLLQRIRNEELQSTDVTKAVELLNDSFEAALKLNPFKSISGLVEQQRWFRKMRQSKT